MKKKGERHLIISKPLMAMLLLMLSLAAFSIAAQAETAGWNNNTSYGAIRVKNNMTCQVEAGQSFYLSDYFFIYKSAYVGGEFFQSAAGTKIKYTSSNKKVASVSGSYGKVTAKKAGTAKIKAVYKGKTYTCTLKVKKKGALKTTTVLSTLNNASKKLARYYSASYKTLTAKCKKNYRAMAGDYFTFKMELAKKDVKKLIRKNRVLGVPTYRRASDVASSLMGVISEFNTEFKITSISVTAGSDTAKITISSPITFAQILNLQDEDQITAFSETQTAYKSGAKETYALDVIAADGSVTHCGTVCTFTVGSNEVTARLLNADGSARVLGSGESVGSGYAMVGWSNKITSPAA